MPRQGDAEELGFLFGVSDVIITLTLFWDTYDTKRLCFNLQLCTIPPDKGVTALRLIQRQFFCSDSSTNSRTNSAHITNQSIKMFVCRSVGDAMKIDSDY